MVVSLLVKVREVSGLAPSRALAFSSGTRVIEPKPIFGKSISLLAELLVGRPIFGGKSLWLSVKPVDLFCPVFEVLAYGSYWFVSVCC